MYTYCDRTHSSHEWNEWNRHFFWAWALTVEKFKKANSLVGCQLLDWGHVNTELRESSWWFTDLTRTDRAEVAHWRQVSYGFCQKDDWPERSDWDVTEGSLPVVEIPTLRQDERGKDLLLCVAWELAAEKLMPCKFTECMFLKNWCGKIHFLNYVDVLEMM